MNDRLVSPITSIQFAKLVKSEVVELDSNCGHRAHRCEQAKMGHKISDFLGTPQ